MDTLSLARALHVVAVVIWIGGLALVTTSVLPAARRQAKPEEGLAAFEAIESRFAPQARIATLIAGASGFYMTAVLDLWDRFTEASFWWMHAMVCLWAIFMVMLFILDPFFLHRWLRRMAAKTPERIFPLLSVMHWVLLTAALITVGGAVAGSHGGLF